MSEDDYYHGVDVGIDIYMDRALKAEAKVNELELQLVPLQQQFDDWAEQNRFWWKCAKVWKRAAKKRRMKFFELLDDCEVIDSTYDYWKRIATRRKEWATVWKQRAHLDYMRAFQWRKLATRRLELLRKLDEWLQREPDCPFCGLMCWDDDSARWQHADDCELKKELET